MLKDEIAFLKQNKSITEFDLSERSLGDNEEIRLVQLTELVDTLNNNLPHIKSLILNHCSITDKEATILTGLAHVERLYLQHNNINKTVREFIAKPKFRFVDLTANNIKDTTIKDILGDIENHNLVYSNVELILELNDIQQSTIQQLQQLKKPTDPPSLKL